MLIQFEEYLTFENIYIFSNYGILPFWLLLIAVPNSKITQILVNSIILPLILSTAYVYVLYQAILLDEPLGLDSSLICPFSSEYLNATKLLSSRFCKRLLFAK